MRKSSALILVALSLAGCAKANTPSSPVYPDAARLPTLPPSKAAASPSPRSGTRTPTYSGTQPTEVPATFYYTFTPHPATPTSTPAGTATPTHVPGPEDYRLSTLFMVDDLNGWGTFRVGESYPAQYWLGVTHDGAHTWLNTTPPVFEAMRAYLLPNLSVMGGAIQIEPLDSETAWAFTRCLFLTACNFPPGIWLTEDGGRSWRTVHVPTDCAGIESDCIPDTLQFVDPQHGWVFMREVGRNSITYHLYRTVDGGFTWQALPRRIDWIFSDLTATRPIFLDQTLGLRLQRIYVSSRPMFAHVVPLDQLLVGTAFTIEITRDGGDSWIETRLPLPPNTLVEIKAQGLTEEDELLIDYSPLTIASMPPLIGFQAFLTLERDQPPIFQATYFSTDRGRSWQVLSKPGDNFFLDAENGWRLAADPSELEVTTDGGNTWQPYLESTWQVGKSGERNVAIHLTEGGQSHQEIETSFLDERLWSGQGVRLESLHMQDRLAGWGVEVGGVTLCTRDGARTWTSCAPERDGVPSEAVPPDTEGTWSPALPLPDELFHGEPIPAELQRWMDNGRQFLPGIKGDDVGFNPFAYFCKTLDADVMGDGELGVGRRCLIRFPTKEGSVYGYYFGDWITYYSLTHAGELQQVWPRVADIDFIDGQLGWRLLDTGTGLFRLEQTTDGGNSWKLVKTVSWIGQLEFVGPEEGYALSFEPPSRDTPAELVFIDAMRPAALLHTVDGGRTWEEIQPVIAP